MHSELLVLRADQYILEGRALYFFINSAINYVTHIVLHATKYIGV